MKRYSITYCSAPTGFGWAEETDSISEVRRIVRSESYGKCISAAVDVWDSKKHGFIFVKRCFCYKPEINLVNEGR